MSFNKEAPDSPARQQVREDYPVLAGDYALTGHLQASGRTAEDFEALWSMALPAGADDERALAARAGA